MRRFLILCLTALFCVSLTACGPREHRVLATTAVGAVAGAGLTAAFDGDPLAGALIGGGIGALGGYAINSHYAYHPRHHGRHYGHRPPRYHRGWR
ncbi:MAG: hypothetical protein IJB29_03070 [Mailhella sp.]|nr:hypothetical protein [Mailhella sp.]